MDEILIIPIGRGLSVRLGLHESWLKASCSSWKLVPVLANLGGPDFDYTHCLLGSVCVCVPWVTRVAWLHEYETWLAWKLVLALAKQVEHADLDYSHWVLGSPLCVCLGLQETWLHASCSLIH